MATSLADLPRNVLTEILARLPLKTLFIAKCVCKTFLQLTSPDPHFTALHPANASQILIFYITVHGTYRSFSTRLCLVDPELEIATKNFPIENSIYRLPDCPALHNEYVLANSCNGLLFFVDSPWLEYGVHSLVCNPVTKEYLPIHGEGGEDAKHGGLRLGFSPGSNQYKVLKLYRPQQDNQDHVIQGKVLDVGSSSWRPVKGGGMRLLGHPMFYESLDGILYWIDDYDVNGTICFFDFQREEFGAIKLPDEVLDYDQEPAAKMTVGLLGGRLCLLYNYYGRNEWVLWVLEKSDNRCNWTKTFVVISTEGHFLGYDYWIAPIQILTNGDILLQTFRGELVWCNPMNMSIRVISQVDSNKAESGRIANLTPSFVPLKDTLKVSDEVIVKY